MKKTHTIRAVDLFCGAGGTSTGLQLACKTLGLKLQLIAINHWDIAIKTHSQNHPEADHFCTNIDLIDPRKAVPSGKLDLLVASPECTHHSIARGGKPINDQSRTSAWRVVEWASQLDIKRLVIENVKEFQTWGPIGTSGRPLKRQKGATYFAFLKALESLGYTVEARVLNAADYGDPTSRERLFIQAVKGRKPIAWPAASHRSKKQSEANYSLFSVDPVRPHRPAREIIDWSIPGESIFTRKKPLAPATMQRIAKGLEKFCGLPLPALDTSNRYGLVRPYIIPVNHGKNDFRSHDIEKPMPAITSVDAWGLIEPYVIKYNGTGGAMSVDDPLDTVTAKDRFGLVEAKPIEGEQYYVLDIYFRMLQPHELAAAMGFPKSYFFFGNREQKVKQIGNAVAVNLATALCKTVLESL